MRTSQLAVALLMMVILAPVDHAVQAHDPVSTQKATELPTSYERALMDACSPCVKEAYPVATLSVPPVRLPSATRLSSVGPTRAGEIGFEVLRAHVLDRPERQFLAIRMTLSVAPGGGGEVYRIAVGLLDGAQLPGLEKTVTRLARIATTPPNDTDPESSEIDFQGGSLRIGLFRFRNESVVYVQAGEPSLLAQRPVLEMPNTIYMPPSQLPALAAVIGQASARMKRLAG